MSVNPRVDVAFKKIFGVEENKDILMALLNAIVCEEDQMDDIELLNPYNERNFKNDKLSILDVKARNKHTKTYFLVEMQVADETDYHKRSLYSWARVYANQLSAGKNYEALRKTIAIHILNFTFIHYEHEEGWTVSAPNKYHHRFILVDSETQIHIHKDLEIHTLELNKFEGTRAEDLDAVVSTVKNMLDAWLAVLTHHELLDPKALPKVLNTPEIRKALGVMEALNFTPTERELYDAHLDFLRMEYSALKARFKKGLEKGLEKGLAKGLAKGLVKGLAKGLEEGLAKGLEEGRQEERIKAQREKKQLIEKIEQEKLADKHKMAKKLLLNGIDVDTVTDVTGLDAKVVMVIKEGS